MEWYELYSETKEPTFKDISKYVNSKLWEDFNEFIIKTYNISPTLSYSKCAMDKGFFRGWNMKYKKSGKTLGTYYPKEGYFVALVTVGQKELHETELILPSFSKYVQNLYKNSDAVMGSRWLAIEVTSEKILEDLKWLIKTRISSK